MKKSIAIVLVVALMLVLIPVTALAATITAGSAAELASAITNADPGDTIQLTADISGIEQMTVNKVISIDMNGFDISGSPSSYTAFMVEGGGDLTLATTAGPSGLYLGAGEDDEYGYIGIRDGVGGKVTIGADVSVEAGCPVFIYGDGTAGSAQLDVYGKLEVSACFPGGDAYTAVQGNGGAGKGGTIVNIYDGAEIINPFSMGMYIPQDGEVNVFGGTIIAHDAAIGIKAGTLNISGGTLMATGPANIPTEGFSNGINASGCAIQIESNDAYSGNIVVNISGGDITSVNGYAIYEYLDSGNVDTEVTGINISGGVFHSTAGVDSDMLISEELDASGVVVITGGIFSKGGYTDVSADVNPTYTIVIPASVDFGTLIKDTGTKEMDFTVKAKELLLEAGYHIEVSVTGPYIMRNEDGTGDVTLGYGLWNSTMEMPEGVGMFASFSEDGEEEGSVTVNTSNIEAAGSYKGTINFTISYAD